MKSTATFTITALAAILTVSIPVSADPQGYRKISEDIVSIHYYVLSSPSIFNRKLKTVTFQVVIANKPDTRRITNRAYNITTYKTSCISGITTVEDIASYDSNHKPIDRWQPKTLVNDLPDSDPFSMLRDEICKGLGF